jgi:hypothetical protein
LIKLRSLRTHGGEHGEGARLFIDLAGDPEEKKKKKEGKKLKEDSSSSSSGSHRYRKSKHADNVNISPIPTAFDGFRIWKASVREEMHAASGGMTR